ncbi:MAG: glycosyl hydrolase family 18 protein [Lachnospiraceae bacterium]|nr:glycosyl hydrolase family 18 protein [Lachnospiraceae bacterium]
MIYVVKPGDTVDRIAQEYNVAAASIAYNNQIPYPYRLAVGQSLFLPGEKGETAAAVNGYAYPFIREWVLRQTLPYLTELSVFSYGFTAEGTLIAPALDDQWMINTAYEYGVKPILTLTPFGLDGQFNNYLISAVVNNEAAGNRLISQLQEVLYEKGFAGVDVDFEFVLASDRDAFTAFVEKLAKALHVDGYQVSVALAPKTSADQPGLLYAGKDYRGLGAAADHVLLMTYEWGYKYGPPMAIAPIDKVREVVDYAITEIPPSKIDLGIPNYGYDWPLPYSQGKTRARTIGNVEAVQLAIRYGAVIQFDQTAQSPYFRYTARDGIMHEVWFEDVRSLQAKFALVKEYGLRGMGYWQIMQFFRANWLLLESMFRTIRDL